MGWASGSGRACRAGAERAADGDLRELLGELAGDSALHSRLVRTALERLGPGGALTEPDRPG